MISCACATRGLRRNGEGVARCPSCSQNAHGERGGMTPVLIPCSRSAHDKNVLARRPQLGTNPGHLRLTLILSLTLARIRSS